MNGRPLYTLGAVAVIALCGDGCARVTRRTAPRTDDVRTLAWHAGPPVPKARDHHVTFLVPDGRDGAFLLVAGGNDYHAVLRDVWRIHLGRDGEPDGPWIEQAPLLEPLAGPGLATGADLIVLAGGQDESLHKRPDVYVVRTNARGDLTLWVRADRMPAPRFHSTLTYHNGWLYSIGGVADRTSVADVYRARLDQSGNVSRWEATTPLSRPRSHHAAFIVAGRLCVVAGLDGDPAGTNTPLADAECATIANDGSLSTWFKASDLPNAYATHAVVAGPSWVMLLGGVENNKTVSNIVLRATIGADGMFGPWTATTPLPNARSHVHQTPVWRNHVYSVGGSAQRVATGEFSIGVFTP